MNNSFEINYIKKCLELAEARLNRGDGSEWTTYDFEKLSEAIEEATGVMLSVTTLKRLWGKLKYTNMPATTTLNTLAQYAGYADWREFKRLAAPAPGEKAGAAPGEAGNAGVQSGSLPGKVIPGEVEKAVAGADAALTNTVSDKLPGDAVEGADVILADIVPHPLGGDTTVLTTGHISNNPAAYSSKTNGGAGSYTNNSPVTPRKRHKWPYWLLALLPAAILVYALLLSNTKPGKPLNTAAFSFSSNKIVGEGVPNSVVFNYNAVAAGEDSVFISQSWDIRRKVPVSAKENTFTTIYYTPGYFRAKLMVDKQIVKEHDLMIGSGGWLASRRSGVTSPPKTPDFTASCIASTTLSPTMGKGARVTIALTGHASWIRG